ncbi:MAG TPA: TolC family protein [Candidatus Binataceae bacterium]|nr:TolC family protein [Candidatus Binataceae bacterium]
MWSLPAVLRHQWSPGVTMPPETLLTREYLGSSDPTVNQLSLKQVIYLALRNNPNVLAARMVPVGSAEAVEMAQGEFDPRVVASPIALGSVVPGTSVLSTVDGSHNLSTAGYQWNFTINKMLAASNGRLTVFFENQWQNTNSYSVSINPSYTPSLGFAFLQPLLRDFGLGYATINIDIAKSANRQAQLGYAQQLNDLVQAVADDYWNLYLAEANLKVARQALQFDQEVIRDNAVAVRVGKQPPIMLEEARAAAATDRANLDAAIAAVRTARAVLRQDAMLNPAHTFLPQRIEPAQSPNVSENVTDEEEHSLENAIADLPSLAAMREGLRRAKVMASWWRNQLLPQLNFSAQFEATSLAGEALCGPSIAGLPTNCLTSGSALTPPGAPGYAFLPFSGSYATALNRMLDSSFYQYAVTFSFEMPLDDAVEKAYYEQAKMNYEQMRRNYSAALAQVVVNVQGALANLASAVAQIKATEAATRYWTLALSEEQKRFRVGTAAIHDILQYKNQLVAAQGAQVQSAVALEQAKLALRHADGTLLKSFKIQFQVADAPETPWFAQF